MNKISVAIVYTTLSGNTEEVAEQIQDTLYNLDVQCDRVDIDELNAIELIKGKDLVFIGSYTINNGQLPNVMRNFLTQVIREHKIPISKVAIFGTGDTGWPHYCRAVEEMKYHLEKVAEVLGTLKIEQAPRGNQKNKAPEFTRQIMEGLGYEVK